MGNVAEQSGAPKRNVWRWLIVLMAVVVLTITGRKLLEPARDPRLVGYWAEMLPGGGVPGFNWRLSADGTFELVHSMPQSPPLPGQWWTADGRLYMQGQGTVWDRLKSLWARASGSGPPGRKIVGVTDDQITLEDSFTITGPGGKASEVTTTMVLVRQIELITPEAVVPLPEKRPEVPASSVE